MFINFYTTRLILSALGVEDYGIYNVVGGVISLFSFLNGPMTITTQRFFSFEIGKGKNSNFNKVLSTSLIIHCIISLIIFILSETIGLYIVFYNLNIPIEKFNIALWVYQISIITSIIGVISLPYNASIIAHEKMGVFALISIIEAILKLATAYLLLISNTERLILYSIIILFIKLIVCCINYIYCKLTTPDISFRFQNDKHLFKEMTSFAGWNLWGGCAYIAFTQGVNLLLNIFFGPAVNAARAICTQVHGCINGFINNFQTALNPQLIKTFAKNDIQYMHNLIFSSSRITFILLLIISLPILFKTSYILDFWLEETPQYTTQFIQLSIFIVIIEGISNPLITSIDATGKIKKYHSLNGCILLSIFPLSYIIIKLGGTPTSTYIIHLIISIIAYIVRIYIIQSIIKFSISQYFHSVLFKCIIIALISSIIPYIISELLPDNFIYFLIYVICCIINTLFICFIIGLSKNEKQYIKQHILSFIQKSK